MGVAVWSMPVRLKHGRGLKNWALYNPMKTNAQVWRPADVCQRLLVRAAGVQSPHELLATNQAKNLRYKRDFLPGAPLSQRRTHTLTWSQNR